MQTSPHNSATVLVRGCGDVGSAVAHRLYDAGYRVFMHDVPAPAHTRRGMALGERPRRIADGVVAAVTRALR